MFSVNSDIKNTYNSLTNTGINNTERQDLAQTINDAKSSFFSGNNASTRASLQDMETEHDKMSQQLKDAIENKNVDAMSSVQF